MFFFLRPRMAFTFVLRVIIFFVLSVSLVSSQKLHNECSPGYYLPPSSEDCIACPAGTYQPKSGAFGCIPCQSDFVSESEASTSCKACVKPRVSDKNNIECICKPGYAINYKNGTCFPCPPGTVPRKHNGVYLYCEKCVSNSYQPNEGSVECQYCTGNTHSGIGAIRCVPCGEGQALIDGVCGTCRPGYYFDSYLAQCLPCRPGTFSSGVDLFTCYNCPKGSTSGAGYSECVRCKKETALMADRTCAACQVGQYYDPYSMSCKSCRPGFSTPTVGTYRSCFNCGSRGFSIAGSPNCKKCKNGSTLIASGVCGTCPFGTFLDAENGRECKLCEIGTYGRGGVSEYCPICPQGEYALYGADSCSTCLEGEALILSKNGCGTCSPGNYYDNRSATCKRCPQNYFKATVGLGPCKLCQSGSRPSNDSITCLDN